MENEIEAYFTDLISAVAASIGAAFAELEPRIQGNFKTRLAVDAIRQLSAKVPAGTRNREAIIAVHDIFVAALSGKPEQAPSVPLPRAARPATARRQTSQAKRNP